MKRILSLLIAVPAALILVSLALANRHSVRLALNPFRPDDQLLSINLPFYGYLLCALIAGVALGGIVTWFNQGRWRRDVRIHKGELKRWRSETERLVRERDEMVTARKAAERTSEGGGAVGGAVAAKRQLAVAGR